MHQRLETRTTIPKNYAPDAENSPKLFIGGIWHLTSQEAFRNYFGQFGQMADCCLMICKKTSKKISANFEDRSRRFGFVTYMKKEIADLVFEQEHFIDGKKVDLKRATPKALNLGDMANRDPSFVTNKIFVGGLPKYLDLRNFRSAFRKYGRIIDIVIIKNKETSLSRGFGFVEFEKSDSVEKLMKDYYTITINGKWVECKKALPRENFLNEENSRNRQSEEECGYDVNDPVAISVNNRLDKFLDDEEELKIEGSKEGRAPFGAPGLDGGVSLAFNENRRGKKQGRLQKLMALSSYEGNKENVQEVENSIEEDFVSNVLRKTTIYGKIKEKDPRRNVIVPKIMSLSQTREKRQFDLL